MTTKSPILLLSAFFIFLFSGESICQNVVTPAPRPKDEAENISVQNSGKFPSSLVKPTLDITNLLDPALTTITFDDLVFSDDNSIEISPNRYSGVSFSSYYPDCYTFLTRLRSYSYPNSLIVGCPVYNPGGYEDILSVERLIVDFTQPAKDVSFLWGRDGHYSSGQIVVYNEAYQIIATVPVGLGGAWTSISLNQYSQRIKRVILYRPAVSNSLYGHFYLDNFQFTPITTQLPIGNFDGVSISEGAAKGWSLDPDNQTASNSVDCYIGSTFVGRATANLPSPDVPHPGNHRFSLPIPLQYRDGNQYTISCYGLDVTGNDGYTHLTGSPRTFRFNPPIGYQGDFLPDGIATGWSLDPDVPLQSNSVHFYVDGPAGGGGTLIGEALANIPRPDVNQVTGHPGNHGYEFYIPAQYRDNQQHTLYAYGLDLTGDQSKVLLASPKTFNLPPGVSSTIFVSLPGSPLTPNNNPGGGLRMFPESAVPGGAVNNSVYVKAKVSVNVAGIPVYFFAYDLDDPWTDAPPIDTNRGDGNDNRSDTKISNLCPELSSNCYDTAANTFRVLTDSNGEAIIPFRLTGAHPGDNYAIVATTKLNETSQIITDGITLRNNVTGRLMLENVDRTPMITAWRTLHIERDSMGTVVKNFMGTSPTSEFTVGAQEVTIPVGNTLDIGRFENGRMQVDGNHLFINNNSANSISVRSLGSPVTVLAGYLYTLYDDDDFNNDNVLNGFDADIGEDVTALGDTYDRLKENDDRNCDDTNGCNVFADAYVQPSYSWAAPFSTSDVPFKLNVNELPKQVEGQIDLGRNLNSGENDNFWLAYVQIAYQHSVGRDNDPNDENAASCGVTVINIFTDENDVETDYEVPDGHQGSLVYIEVMKEGHNAITECRTNAVPHEIGHQFGILGDFSEPGANFGLMGYNGGRKFVDRHLNMIRWRRRSPGTRFEIPPPSPQSDSQSRR